jgi:hypothetical protein
MDIQLGDIATWIASAGAVVFGGLGFWRAGKANKTAADALVAGKRQATSAEKANLTADEALEVARRATKAAEESAAEAKRTADLAELSNARLGERNDVVWKVQDGREGGIWRATNAGADVGYRARVILKGDGVDVHSHARDVGHGESIEIDLQDRWAEIVLAGQEANRQYAATGRLTFTATTLRITFRILWETRTGTEHVWTTELAIQKAQEARNRNQAR